MAQVELERRRQTLHAIFVKAPPLLNGLINIKLIYSLSLLLGETKDLGILYINIIRGAKEPRNLQNHRGV